MEATVNARCCSKLKHFLQATKIYVYKLSRTSNPWKANQKGTVVLLSFLDGP